MTCEECRTWTPAWIDREMEPELAGRFALHLEGCPGCRERVEAELSFVLGMQRRLPRQVLPDTERARLRNLLRGAERSAERLRWLGRTGRWALAAGLVLAATLAIQGSLAHSGGDWTSAFRSDHMSHRDGTGDLEIRSGSAPEVAAWFQRRLGSPSHVPTMADARLVGGRISRLDGKPVGLAVYESGGRRLSLFLGPASILHPSRPVPPDDQLISREYERCSVVAWAHAGHFHVAVSDLPLARLQELARQCQRNPA
jgi:anti-sigma factor RsiW